MTDPHYIGTILYVSLSIYAALLAAGLLMQERRYSVRKTALLWGAEGLILLLDMYLCFGLLPVPLRLPVSLTIGFFSYAGVFIAVSADGFWKKVYLLITFFCVCCISWSAGLYLCFSSCRTVPQRYSISCARRSILPRRCRSCWHTGSTAGRCFVRSAASRSGAGGY